MRCFFAANHAHAIDSTNNSFESVSFVLGIEGQTGDATSVVVIVIVHTTIFLVVQQSIHVLTVKIRVHGKSQKDQMPNTPNPMAQEKMSPTCVQE